MTDDSLKKIQERAYDLIAANGGEKQSWLVEYFYSGEDVNIKAGYQEIFDGMVASKDLIELRYELRSGFTDSFYLPGRGSTVTHCFK